MIIFKRHWIIICALLSLLIMIVNLNMDIWSNMDIKMEQYEKEEMYQYPFPFYIFQIGFNKAGTTSLYQFFIHNNIPSISYKINQSNIEEPQLSDIMYYQYYNNNKSNILPFNGTKFMYYGDFGEYLINGSHDFDILCIENNRNCIPWYKILLNKYPNNSIFILNIRNINNWLKSRYTYPFPNYSVRFIKRNIKKYQNNEKYQIQILNDWTVLWYQYICNLLTYFIDNHLSHQLLIFDIEIDSIHKLIKYFASFGINLDSKYFTQQRKTQRAKKWIKKWENILAEHPQFADNTSHEINNIQKQCSLNLNTFKL